MRQQVAQGEHREAPVAAQGDGLPAWICQLRAERIGRSIGHGRPGKRAEKSAISAAADMSCQPYACGAGIGKKHRIVGSDVAQRRSQEFRTNGLDPRPFVDIMLQEIVKRVRLREMLLQEAAVRLFIDAL